MSEENNILESPISLGSEATLGSPTNKVDEGGLPRITIRGPEALDIPEEFIVMLKGHRGPIHAHSSARGQKAEASVDLHLHTLLHVEECESDEPYMSEGERRDAPIDRLFEQAREEEAKQESEEE